MTSPTCLREGSFLSDKWMACGLLYCLWWSLEVTGQGHTLDPLCIHGTIISQVDCREVDPQQEMGTLVGVQWAVFVLATEHMRVSLLDFAAACGELRAASQSWSRLPPPSTSRPSRCTAAYFLYVISDSWSVPTWAGCRQDLCFPPYAVEMVGM